MSFGVSFLKAIAFSLKWEGGYANHPNDPGGETKFGISKRAHPDVEIADLTIEDAQAIYRAKYWNRSAGALEPSPGSESLGAALLDFSIHSGVSRAVKELQAVSGVEPDGEIGPITRAAVERRAFDLLALELVKRRRNFLEGLVEAKPDLGTFSRGWDKRLDDLEDEIARHAFA